jgi:hypothetical protein
MFIINYFFKGLIVGKLPFHISLKFKELLQNGTELENLGNKYISSTSLYLLSFMGITKIVDLMFQSNQPETQN